MVLELRTGLGKAGSTAAWKHYKGLGGIAEVKEDRERAYETAVRAAELRLRAEARLGSL